MATVLYFRTPLALFRSRCECMCGSPKDPPIDHCTAVTSGGLLHCSGNGRPTGSAGQ